MYFLEQTGSSVESGPDVRGYSMDPKNPSETGALALRTDAGIKAKLLGKDDLRIGLNSPAKGLASCQDH